MTIMDISVLAIKFNHYWDQLDKTIISEHIDTVSVPYGIFESLSF